MNTIDIETQDLELPCGTEELQEFLQSVCRRLGLEDVEVSLQFCSDQQMRSYNREYRGKDEPTDILSFAQLDEIDMVFPGDSALLGDLIISVDTLKRNAKYFMVDEEVELKRILIHGMLHLTGQDHQTNDDTEPMIIYQEQLLHDLLGTDDK